MLFRRGRGFSCLGVVRSKKGEESYDIRYITLVFRARLHHLSLSISIYLSTSSFYSTFLFFSKFYCGIFWRIILLPSYPTPTYSTLSPSLAFSPSLSLLLPFYPIISCLNFLGFCLFFCRVFFCFYLCNNSFFLLSFFLSFCCSYRVLLVLSGVFILEIGVTGGPTGWCGPSSARPNQPNQLTGLTNQPTQSPYLPYYTTVLSGFSILISTLLCCDSALLHSTIFNHRNNAIITQQHTHTHNDA